MFDDAYYDSRSHAVRARRCRTPFNNFQLSDGREWRGGIVRGLSGADVVTEVFNRGDLLIPATAFASASLSTRTGSPVCVLLSADLLTVLQLSAGQWADGIGPGAYPGGCERYVADGRRGELSMIPWGLCGVSPYYD